MAEDKVKKISKIHIVMILLLIVGFVAGIAATNYALYPYLNPDKMEQQKQEAIAYQLLREEVDCYLQNCSETAIENCGLK